MPLILRELSGQPRLLSCQPLSNGSCCVCTGLNLNVPGMLCNRHSADHYEYIKVAALMMLTTRRIGKGVLPCLTLVQAPCCPRVPAGHTELDDTVVHTPLLRA